MHQEERFVLVTSVFQPVNSYICNNIRRISICLYLIFRPFFVTYFICKKCGIKIFTLSSMTVKNFVIIKVCRFVFQMPFTHHGSLISHFAEFLHKILSVYIKFFVKCKNFVMVRVLSGHYACTARSADRVRTETIIEYYSVTGQFINIRSRIKFCQMASVSSNSLRSVVI